MHLPDQSDLVDPERFLPEDPDLILFRSRVAFNQLLTMLLALFRCRLLGVPGAFCTSFNERN